MGVGVALRVDVRTGSQAGADSGDFEELRRQLEARKRDESEGSEPPTTTGLLKACVSQARRGEPWAAFPVPALRVQTRGPQRSSGRGGDASDSRMAKEQLLQLRLWRAPKSVYSI